LVLGHISSTLPHHEIYFIFTKNICLGRVEIEGALLSTGNFVPEIKKLGGMKIQRRLIVKVGSWRYEILSNKNV
jgi:hypothetical protein